MPIQERDFPLHEALREGAVAVTANRRLAREIVLAYGRARMDSGASVWPSPEVRPLSAWLSDAWEGLWRETPVLGQTASEVLWEEAVASDGPSALLDPSSAVESAAEAHRLVLWYDIDLRRSGSESLYLSEETRAFLRWRKRYARALGERGWVDGAELPLLVAEALRRGEIAPPREMLLAGFDEHPPAHRELFRALEGAGCRVRSAASPRRSSRPVRFRAADPARECRAAALWALDFLQRSPGARLGIVAPRLDAYRDLLERTLTETLAPASLTLRGPGGTTSFDLSLGRPLGEEPVVRAALEFLALASGRAVASRWRGLVLSPFWGRGAVDRVDCARLAEKLSASRREEWSLSEVADEALRAAEGGESAFKAVGERLQALAENAARWPRAQSPSAWARAFGEYLEEAGWRSRAGYSSGEYQAAAAFEELLGELGTLDAVMPRAEREWALRRCGRLASAPHRPEGGDAPVRVLGMLEAAGLSFDGLWLLGADADALPQPARPNPFLPYEWQRAAGVRQATPEGQLERAGIVAGRLFGAAAEVVASHPGERDGAECLPSPFTRSFPEKDFEHGRDLSPRGQVRSRSPTRLERRTDGASPLPDHTPARGGSRLFQDQANCPFRAVALHRLGIREQGKQTDLLDPLEQGNDLHAALHHLMGRYPSRRALAEADPAERAEAVRRAAAWGLRRLERDRGVDLPPRLRHVEADRLEALLDAWIETDLGRPEFEVVEREAVKRIVVEGLEVSLKVDRVDRMADGGEVILDYKSGDSALPDDDDRLDAPQLPLYALACPAARAVAYAVLDPARWGPRVVQAVGMSPFGTGAKRPRSVEDWEALRQAWRGKLETLAREFRSGDADLAADGSVCRRCALPAFCRREASAGETEEEA